MATYAPTQPAVAPPAVPASSVSIPAESSVRLQYKDQSPIQVRGLATGLIYSFSGAELRTENGAGRRAHDELGARHVNVRVLETLHHSDLPRAPQRSSTAEDQRAP